jgi:hypothetical protein
MIQVIPANDNSDIGVLCPFPASLTIIRRGGVYALYNPRPCSYDLGLLIV